MNDKERKRYEQAKKDGEKILKTNKKREEILKKFKDLKLNFDSNKINSKEYEEQLEQLYKEEKVELDEGIDI